MRYRHDPEGLRLPIKLDSTSNGEFVPIPLSRNETAVRRLALESATASARRLCLSRRDYLVSLCGAAATLLAFNTANAARGANGGRFELAGEAAMEPDAASAQLGAREFIFDVQGHYVPPSQAEERRARCHAGHDALSRDYMRCLGADDFIKDVFLDADTDMMVLSFVPSRRDDEPLTIEEAAATREIVERMDGSHRLLLHGRVNPNQPGDLEDMERLVNTYQVSAFKTYTQWGPGGRGYYLTDDIGIAFIERARALGVNNICIHKGIPLGRRSYAHSRCTDIGPIARRFPDVNFLIYHSGWVPGQAEGPWDPRRLEGIDGLINSLKAAGLGTGSNVYAELGSTWRYLSLRDPDSAAHALGKLFVHLGADNVLWGTDSIWYGSPQDQIQAFRAFQISREYRERYGYPEITPALRAKVFGLNATRPYRITAEEVQRRAAGDAIARQRLAYREQPDPHFATRGPRTRREFLQLLRAQGGRIG